MTLPASLLALRLVLGPDEETIDLDWDAPPGCPGADEVRQRLARFVTAGASGPRVAVDARVHAGAEGYVLDLEIRIESGVLRRRIDAAACDVLASATALVTAVMLDPANLAERVEAAPDPTPAPSPVASAPVPSAERKPRARRRPAVDVALGLRAGGSWGWLPRGAAIFAPHLALRVATARIELVGVTALHQDRRSSTEPSAGARFQPWVAGARGCWAPVVGPVELPICTGIEAGQIRAQGFGLATPQSIAATWVAWPFGASIMWAPHRRVAILAGVEGWVAVARPRFVVADLGALYAPPRAGVRLFAGVEVRVGK